MIRVTKQEASLLRKLFPEFKIARTMVHDSKRHHYYAVEDVELMRAISNTNTTAAEIVKKIDNNKNLRFERVYY